MAALFHLHKRKRFHLNLEQFPHPKKWKKFLDKVIYAAGIAASLLVIPQVVKIWFNQDASGVSAFSWTGFTVLAVIWLIYGIAHKEKPLIVMYTGLIIFDGLVALGAFIYG